MEDKWVKVKRTTASKISDRFSNDGQVWKDADGVYLAHALNSAVGVPEGYREFTGPDGSRKDRKNDRDEVVRWTFADGSVITIAGDGWDFGYPGCYCWEGAGHTDECRDE